MSKKTHIGNQTYHNSLIVIHLGQRFTIGEYLINSGGPRPNIPRR